MATQFPAGDACSPLRVPACLLASHLAQLGGNQPGPWQRRHGDKSADTNPHELSRCLTPVSRAPATPYSSHKAGMHGEDEAAAMIASTMLPLVGSTMVVCSVAQVCGKRGDKQASWWGRLASL